MEFEDLKKHIGEEIILKGDTFKLVLDYMCGTIYLGKLGEEFVIYATLNYEGIRGIPFEVDNGEGQLFYDMYEGEIKDFQDYIKKCETMYEMFLTNLEYKSTQITK